MTNKSIIVFYHIKDNDGLGAAWSAWEKFKSQADYIGIDYHIDFSTQCQHKTIYFLDIRPRDELVKQLRANDNYLILIDHHLSSIPKLPLFNEYKFSLDHSAAVLSWQYFFPKKKIPKMLRYIEDIDLWRLKMPFSRDINNALELYSDDFRKWGKIAKALEHYQTRKKYLQWGKIITQYQDRLIKKIIAKAKLVKFEGRKVFAVNSPILISEVGNALVKKRPPLSIIWTETNQKTWVSLRSNKSCDVSKIAEKYGGGGQKGAAAFILNKKDPFPWEDVVSK